MLPVVRGNALEDNVRFYRVIKGRREELEGASIKVTANEWHNAGLRAEGRQFHDYVQRQTTVLGDKPDHFSRREGGAVDQGRQRDAASARSEIFSPRQQCHD